MKRILLIIILMLGVHFANAKKLPEKKHIIACLEQVNQYFMEHHSPSDTSIYTSQSYPSNVWTRSVYMEGLMALNSVAPQAGYTEYALIWAETNKWNFYGGRHTLSAENQCCAQTYIDLYRMYGNPQAIENVERLLNNVVNNTTRNDWNDVNAIQTAMPVYAKMGALKKDIRYFEKMMELYRYLRNHIGLYNSTDGLWWQSADFIPPCKEPNGQSCYWSRANGWVLAGLARTIDEIDASLSGFPEEHRQQLLRIRQSLAKDFMASVMTVVRYQREDGFWNCSLTDPLHYGGPESSGTSLFIYATAWGIRKQLLYPELFFPIVLKGWNAITEKAIHPAGRMGYVQGSGREPKDGQPISYDPRPDGEDIGTGCLLLAGAELIRILPR